MPVEVDPNEGEPTPLPTDAELKAACEAKNAPSGYVWAWANNPNRCILTRIQTVTPTVTQTVTPVNVTNPINDLTTWAKENQTLALAIGAGLAWLIFRKK